MRRTHSAARLLITGASGYLGRRLMRAAAGRGWEVYGTYHSRPFIPTQGTALSLDLVRQEAVRAILRDLRPAVIIHTACSNRDAGNVGAVVPAARSLAQAAREQDIRLVHVSTDLVFDGEHAPFADDAPLSPLLEYGRAKAEAEAVVSEICAEQAAVIVRPSLIWGLDPLDRQTAWLVESIRHGDRVTLFTDEFRCPTYVHDLVAALLELAVRPDITGPMNLAGPQPLNRWDFGMKLLAALGMTLGPAVVPGTVLESGLIRSRNLILLSARASQLLKTRLRSVDEVLACLPNDPPRSGDSVAEEVEMLAADEGRSRRPRYCEG